MLEDIRTFEILVRTYEVREGKLESFQGGDGNMSMGSRPGKRKQPSSERAGSQDDSSTPPLPVLAKPCSETRGHTGYLTFARLQCSA